MEINDILYAVNNLTHDQPVRVILKSGRDFHGSYDAESTDPEGPFFYFYHMDPRSGDEQHMRAEWDKIAQIDFRRGRALAAGMVVPDTHPLSGKQNPGVTPEGLPRRPFTTRN